VTGGARTSDLGDLGAILRARLQQRRAAGLYRSLRIRGGPTAPLQSLDGRAVVNFCSNDYLGLATHPRVVEAFRATAESYGVGAGAAHLVSGHTEVHAALELRLAQWLGRERALVFSTGYMANLGAVSGLVGPGDTILQDRLNHASLLDAGRLSGARMFRYRDPGHLERLLQRTAGASRLVVTDGVFSMDGHVAALPRLAELCAREAAWLMVDDAHGLGVLGPGGRGSTAQYGLDQEAVPILVGTFGKALGGFGAFVAGSAALIEVLLQQARTYLYTTALPPAVAAAVLAALDLLEQEPERRERLQGLIDRFRSGAAALGLPLSASETPIQPLLLGTPQHAVSAAEALLEAGFWVAAIRPPTVPPGTARLRITLSAAHTPEQVDGLLEALGRWHRAAGIPPVAGEARSQPAAFGERDTILPHHDVVQDPDVHQR